MTYSLNKKGGICIVGAGRVGKQLALTLPDVHTVVTHHIDDSDWIPDRSYFKLIEEKRLKEIDEEILILSVKDRQIEKTIKNLKKRGLLNRIKIIAHTSGALSYHILPEDKYRASIHFPFSFRNFPQKGLLKGRFAVVSGDPVAVDILKSHLEKADIKVIIPDSFDPVGYHCSCVILSNLIWSILILGNRCLQRSGISDNNSFDIIDQLIESAVYNFKINAGDLKGFTGPLVRGDYQTIESHTKWMKKNLKKADLDLYNMLLKNLKDILKDHQLEVRNES